MQNWYVAVNGQTVGPFSLQQLLAGIRSGQYNQTTMVWRDGFSDWLPAGQVPELTNPSTAVQAQAAPPPMTGIHAHEIDYEIFGHEMQFVEIELDPQESVVAEAGSMMYMSDSMQMQTIFGDGSASSQSGGLFDKMLGVRWNLLVAVVVFFLKLFIARVVNCF